MTERSIRKSFETLKSAMRLSHWRTQLAFDIVREDEFANCDCEDVYDVAKVTLGPEATSMPAAELRVILAHELMHMHTRDLARVHEQVLARVPRAQREAWELILDDKVEVLVDRVASIVTELVFAPGA